MTIWSELFSFEPPSDDTPDLPPPAPEGMVRLYLFSGSFADEAVLLDYCFDVHEVDGPTDLTRGQPGAYIDSSYVVTGFGAQIPETLADFFGEKQVEALRHKIGAHNSVILLSEYAFGGFPFSLNDTEELTYHGAFLVEVPE